LDQRHIDYDWVRMGGERAFHVQESGEEQQREAWDDYASEQPDDQTENVRCQGHPFTSSLAAQAHENGLDLIHAAYDVLSSDRVGEAEVAFA
jgi:hypothetical protein